MSKANDEKNTGQNNSLAENKKPAGLFGASSSNSSGSSMFQTSKSGSQGMMSGSGLMMAKPADDKNKLQESSKGLFSDAGGQNKSSMFASNETKIAFGSSSSMFAKKDDSSKGTENKEDKPKVSTSLFGGNMASKKDDAPKQDDKPKLGLFGAKPAQPTADVTASIGPGSKSPFLTQKKPEEGKDKPEEKKTLFQSSAAAPEKKGALPFYDPKKETKSSPFGTDKKDDKPSIFGGDKKDEKKEDKPSIFPSAKKDEKSSPFGKKDGNEISSSSVFGQKSAEKESGDKAAKPLGVFGSKTEEDKKQEEGKAGSAPSAPAFKESDVEVIKKISLEKSKQSELDSTTLEDIFTSWYNKVESQSDGFKKHAKKLKKDELALYDHITMLETLKNYSERVIQDYGTSLTTMQDLANQQMLLMKSLDCIEDDIDDVIRKKNQGINTYNRFRGIPGVDGDDFIDRTNYRQQMSGKAHVVNTTLESIDDAIHNLNKALSSSNSNSAQINEEHSEIGKILNHSYDSLKWIQDTACDLNFQIELIDNELSQM